MLRFEFLFPGNIKWGFTDSRKPIPIDKIQSKWDKEHKIKLSQQKEQEDAKDEYLLTSKAVSWTKVSCNRALWCCKFWLAKYNIL